MPDFNSPYAPAAAENGKFTILTTTELSALGMTTATLSATIGRFAMLTYPVAKAAYYGIDNKSVTLAAASAVSGIAFAAPSKYIEIQNRSANIVYLYWTNPVTFANIASAGYVIPATTNYNIEQQVSNIWLGTDVAGTSVRIINHY